MESRLAHALAGPWGVETSGAPGGTVGDRGLSSAVFQS